MTVASLTDMSPLVLSGAASVANLLISGVSNALSSPAVSVSSQPAPAKGFDHALYKAAGSGVALPSASRSSGQGSGVELQRSSILQLPEIQSAIAGQPTGSVTGVEVREDGSAAISTLRGPVEVALSQPSRESVLRVCSVLSELSRAGNALAAGSIVVSSVPSEADGFPRAAGFVMPLSGASLR